MRITLLVLRVVAVIMVALVVRSAAPRIDEAAAQTDQRYYGESGFRVDNDAIWSYYSSRGGPRAFGFPISRTFKLFGQPTQIFQRHLMQIGPRGEVVVVNLVDSQWMPFNTIAWTLVPRYDQSLASTAPAPDAANYVDAMLGYIRSALPDQIDGVQTNFYRTFAETIAPANPAETDPTAQAMAVVQNLDVWGIPISRPVRDPGNPGDFVVRLERGIFRYSAACRCTAPMPLGTYFKSMLTGVDLPADLELQKKDSPFLRQYDIETHVGPYRAWELHDTDLKYGFLPSHIPPFANELQAPPVEVTPTDRPLIAPTSTPITRPTNTPVPAATNTPVPRTTNTPVPVRTNTPVPVRTNTPVPVDGSVAPPAADAAPPAVQTVGNPIAKQPYEMLIQRAETGKETTLTGASGGDDGQAAWAWVRYERDRTLEAGGLGPYLFHHKIYVARNVDTAKAIYGNEIAVKNFPEAADRFTGFFFLQRPALTEEDQVLASCFEEGCSATRYDIHLRIVSRSQNVVSVFYTFGDQLSSSLPDVVHLARNFTTRMVP